MAKNARSKIYVIGRDSVTGKFISVARAKKRSSTAIVETVRRASADSGRIINEYHTVRNSSGRILSKITRKRSGAIKSLAKR
jgi:hypothetical protein